MKRDIVWIWTLLTLLSVRMIPDDALSASGNICQPEAQRAHDSGRFETARVAFEAASNCAIQGRDQGRTGACPFHLGLAAQLEANTLEVSNPRRALLLQEARNWYEAIPTASRWTGVVENLARVYADT